MSLLKRAVLVTYPNQFILQEAKELAKAAGYEVVEVLTQRYLMHSKYGLGSGKAEELKEIVAKRGCNVILFDESLKSVQIYNLTKLTGVEIIDREKLILEIFAKRASSRESKLQVRLAELEYEMARAKEKVRLAKLGEQPGFYGLGGYEVDVYYRAIKRMTTSIKEKLMKVRKHRELYRQRRLKLGMPTISLAGYTGAGKTTLFNLLTQEDKEVSNSAFTTLTTSTRSITLPHGKALLSDTVGFISRLPTYMIEAFKATLEEMTYANLVLLLLDSSDPPAELRRKYESCTKILSEIGVPIEKTLTIYNKADLCSREEIEEKVKTLPNDINEAVFISAKTGKGLKILTDLIDARLFSTQELPKKALVDIRRLAET
ncbi:MAG: GTPase HflX [Nitrososphaerales archaeon]